MASGAAKFRIKTAAGLTYDLLTALDAAQAHIETRDLDLGDAATSKLVQRLFFEILNRETAIGLVCYVKFRDRLEDPLQVAGPFQLGATSGPITVRIPAAKYVRIRLEDTQVRVVWKLAAFEIWGEITSMRAA